MAAAEHRCPSSRPTSRAHGLRQPRSRSAWLRSPTRPARRPTRPTSSATPTRRTCSPRSAAAPTPTSTSSRRTSRTKRVDPVRAPSRCVANDLKRDPMWDLGVHPLELVARTAVIYVLFFGALRLSGKREIGQFTVFDLALLLLVANALQPAMTGADQSVLGGAIILATIFVLNRLVALARVRISFVRRVLEFKPTTIGRTGDGSRPSSPPRHRPRRRRSGPPSARPRARRADEAGHARGGRVDQRRPRCRRWRHATSADPSVPSIPA